jgi:hypothetical protein
VRGREVWAIVGFILAAAQCPGNDPRHRDAKKKSKETENARISGRLRRY